MSLDPRLLEILACPKDKGPLLYFEDDGFLYNERLRWRYRIDDAIPVMLIDEAEQVSQADHEAIMQRHAAIGGDSSPEG